MNSGMILENTIPPFSIGNHFWYVTMANTVTFLSLYATISTSVPVNTELSGHAKPKLLTNTMSSLLYTSDAADE